MAFTSNPYCTLSDVKAALDLQKTTSDAWIQSLIIEAQADVDEFIGYPFQTDGTTGTPSTRSYINGNDTSGLFIDHCISFASVTEDGRSITSDCFLLPYNQSARNKPYYKLGRTSGIFMSETKYIISGIFGYPIIPANITRACIRLAVHYFKMRDTNYADFLAEQGAVRQKYTKSMPEDIIEILNRYKHESFLCR